MTTAIIHWNETLSVPCRQGALTIGNFDGVHRGHQTLLAEVRRQADRVSGPAVVLTFDPHPLQLLRPDSFPPVLTTNDERAALLHEHGADFVLILSTTPDLLQLRAGAFFDQVIRDQIQPRVVVPGFNFGFGRNREGNVDTLAEFCLRSGMAFVLVAPLELGGKTVSSSRIRAALQAGDVRAATELLGRPYHLSGQVRPGQRRGNTIGFPTANLHDITTLIPADGVYAVRVPLGDKVWAGAANIGPNPTFGENARKVEVHLIGFAGDLYEATLTVEFLERLRDTRSFAGVEQLVEQLHRDVAEAKRIGESGG
jgi:riboflavin kinase/FMN adenylyltransferase